MVVRSQVKTLICVAFVGLIASGCKSPDERRFRSHITVPAAYSVSMPVVTSQGQPNSPAFNEGEGQLLGGEGPSQEAVPMTAGAVAGELGVPAEEQSSWPGASVVDVAPVPIESDQADLELRDEVSTDSSEEAPLIPPAPEIEKPAAPLAPVEPESSVEEEVEGLRTI